MISSAYNYYLSNYIGQEVSKYDTHKKSELRDVYNRIVKVNKNSSIYKINESEDVKKYAIDIKEAARAITNIASELSENDQLGSGFSKKKAISSNSNVIDARYVGDTEEYEDVPELDIKVNNLATSQVNVSNYLKQNVQGLAKGTYSFDFAISGYTYEFQLNVKADDTNRDVQDRIVRLVNKSNLGAKASIVENENKDSAIRIESDSTGVAEYNGTIFRISPNESDDSEKVINYLGIDHIDEYPKNASFTVNGMDKSSSSNTFTIAKQYMISLNASSDEEIHIGLKPDFDSVIENVNELLDKYNNMIDMAKEKAEGGYESGKLYNDIKRIAMHYKDSLDSAGFMVQDDGKINVSESLLIQSANEGTLKDSLDKLSVFKKSLMNKASSISVNPMAYVDKKLISYKNPNNNFNNAYMTSMYSGMMFNGYV